MDAVFRALAVYVAVWLIMRVSGRRTLSEMTAFDFVLILIIGETTQQALLGEDFSITNSVILIITLLFADVAISLVKLRSATIARWTGGVPTVVVANGKPIGNRLRKARLNEDDVMEAARRLQGLEHMKQIKYAVIETTGGISIIPQQEAGPESAETAARA